MASIPGYSKTARPYGNYDLKLDGYVGAKAYITIYKVASFPGGTAQIPVRYEYISSWRPLVWSSIPAESAVPYTYIGNLYSWRRIMAERINTTRVMSVHKSFDDSLEEVLGGSQQLLGGA